MSIKDPCKKKNLLEELKELLSHDDRLTVDGKLLKNKVVESGLKLDPVLIKMLLTHQALKECFFQDVDGIPVFDKIKFQKFVSNKEFLPDSYSAFKNKIGLTTEDTFLSEAGEVVLSWIAKDCVLEGGQTSEESKRDEILWNTVLAPDEIDRLFKPKVLTNFKKYDVNGEGGVKELSIYDNMIIKGNNLLALHSLRRVYAGKVKLTYIDPPYNTGNDGFKYNDSFNHSSWLTFMKNRLEVARELLKEDGSIWINIDDGESHYLKVLCDEIFRRENFIANVIWQKKYAPQNDAEFFSDNHDHILVYAKNKNNFKLNPLPRSDEMDSRYKNPDDDPRGTWKSSDLSVKTYSAAYDYPITTPSGRVVNPPEGRCWQTSKGRMNELIADNRIWFGEDGKNVPSLKKFISDVKEGVTPQTIWTYKEVGHNQEAKQQLNKLLEESPFSTPKPERLIQRILQLGSIGGDIVLDFFAGSGTTAAVSMKMKRRFITCEQMDYCKTVTVERLKKVIAGEQGGISEDVQWNGGGSFVYCELAKQNQNFIDRIEAATDKQTDELLSELLSNPHATYLLNSKMYKDSIGGFNDLPLVDKKKVLLSMLDYNQLYVNLSEINDNSNIKISEDDKKLNNIYYNLK